jgi:hypothetical protein
LPVLNYLADTNSVSDYFRPGNPVRAWFQEHQGEVGLSVFTLAEMRQGIELKGGKNAWHWNGNFGLSWKTTARRFLCSMKLRRWSGAGSKRRRAVIPCRSMILTSPRLRAYPGWPL